MADNQNSSISDLKTRYEKETEISFTDCLTGLFNHGFFQLFLDREIKRSNRYGTCFALAFIDIDSFSDLNRRLGHFYGERVLKTLADIILSNIRETDIAARYSGDTLAVMVIRSNIDHAFEALERIRQAFEDTFKGESTISAGLASFPDDAADKDHLEQNAQKALAAAKLRGKNRVNVFKNKEKIVFEDKPIILVVDDDPRNVKLLDALLRMHGYEVALAFNGKEALSIVNKADVDLILLDVMMPEMDGYEVCRRLKAEDVTRLIPVVMLTSLDDENSKLQGIQAGADDFLSKPFSKIELLARVKSLIDVKRLNNSLTSIEDVLYSLANAVEAKDKYTQGHIERVARMAENMGRKMNLSPKDREALKYGGILHDIGKLVIPSEILNKPGPLTPEEWKIMKAHSNIGFNISQPLKKNLGQALEIILNHHEKMDGSGYPNGKKGEELSIGSRIMAVVDIYDALVTDRPYRKGMPKEKAMEILRLEALDGKLDQTVVDALIELLCDEENNGDGSS